MDEDRYFDWTQTVEEDQKDSRYSPSFPEVNLFIFFRLGLF